MKAQMRNPDEYYHKMNKLKKHSNGEAAWDKKPQTKMEKSNQKKQRVIVENQNIALVNMRK